MEVFFEGGCGKLLKLCGDGMGGLLVPLIKKIFSGFSSRVCNNIWLKSNDRILWKYEWANGKLLKMYKK